VHRHPCGGAHLDMTESSWFGVVTTLSAAVHCPNLSGDQLTMAESSNFRVVTVTAPIGVHRHWHDCAPLLSVQCHRLVLIESRGNRGGTALITARVRRCTALFIQRGGKNKGSPRVAPPPLIRCHCPGDQLVVGQPLGALSVGNIPSSTTR
jgi:hypothetical protein